MPDLFSLVTNLKLYCFINFLEPCIIHWVCIHNSRTCRTKDWNASILFSVEIIDHPAKIRIILSCAIFYPLIPTVNGSINSQLWPVHLLWVIKISGVTFPVANTSDSRVKTGRKHSYYYSRLIHICIYFGNTFSPSFIVVHKISRSTYWETEEQCLYIIHALWFRRHFYYVMFALMPSHYVIFAAHNWVHV